MDVVVPFRGADAELEALLARLDRLDLIAGDTVTVVDNRPAAAGREARTPSPNGTVATVTAPSLQTPGYARNRGVERGEAEWVVFLDADVEARPDLLERLFDPEPAQRTAILAGGVRDRPPPPTRSAAAARYSHLRRSMSQDMTLRPGEWSFVQTSNCACRREAFEAVGGFRDEIRAGEDADLCFRLKAAGWGIERREEAAAEHHSRRTVRALLSQKACHGAAAGWLERAYPGSFPARRLPGLVWWGVRRATTGLWNAARGRNRDEALISVLDPMTTIAFELGRSLPNERPLRWRRR